MEYVRLGLWQASWRGAETLAEFLVFRRLLLS